MTHDPRLTRAGRSQVDPGSTPWVDPPWIVGRPIVEPRWITHWVDPSGSVGSTEGSHHRQLSQGSEPWVNPRWVLVDHAWVDPRQPPGSIHPGSTRVGRPGSVGRLQGDLKKVTHDPESTWVDPWRIIWV